LTKLRRLKLGGPVIMCHRVERRLQMQVPGTSMSMSYLSILTVMSLKTTLCPHKKGATDFLS